MKRRLLNFLLVVLLVAVCSGVRRVLGERRDPLFTFDEHLRGFATDFSVGLMTAAVGPLVPVAAKRTK